MATMSLRNRYQLNIAGILKIGTLDGTYLIGSRIYFYFLFYKGFEPKNIYKEPFALIPR